MFLEGGEIDLRILRLEYFVSEQVSFDVFWVVAMPCNEHVIEDVVNVDLFLAEEVEAGEGRIRILVHLLHVLPHLSLDLFKVMVLAEVILEDGDLAVDSWVLALLGYMSINLKHIFCCFIILGLALTLGTYKVEEWGLSTPFNVEEGMPRWKFAIVFAERTQTAITWPLLGLSTELPGLQSFHEVDSSHLLLAMLVLD